MSTCSQCGAELATKAGDTVYVRLLFSGAMEGGYSFCSQQCDYAWLSDNWDRAFCEPEQVRA